MEHTISYGLISGSADFQVLWRTRLCGPSLSEENWSGTQWHKWTLLAHFTCELKWRSGMNPQCRYVEHISKLSFLSWYVNYHKGKKQTTFFYLLIFFPFFALLSHFQASTQKPLSNWTVKRHCIFLGFWEALSDLFCVPVTGKIL